MQSIEKKGIIMADHPKKRPAHEVIPERLENTLKALAKLEAKPSTEESEAMDTAITFAHNMIALELLEILGEMNIPEEHRPEVAKKLTEIKLMVNEQKPEIHEEMGKLIFELQTT